MAVLCYSFHMENLVETAQEQAEIVKENEALKELVTKQKDRIKWLEKALFGSRSERVISSPDNQLEFDAFLKEFEALNQAVEQMVQKEEIKDKSSLKKPRKARRKLNELIPEDLPREDIVIDVPKEERTCPVSGEDFKKIGEEVSEKLAFKPGSYFVKRYIRPKYAHPTDSSYGVLFEPMIDCAITGSSFDESFTAGIGVNKCAYHLPLYRQQEMMKHVGIDISRQTLSQHYMRGAQALEPLFDLMKKTVVTGKYLFTDDTPVKLQVKGKKKTVTGRMWVYVSGGDSPKYTIFDFTIDRKAEHTLALLKNFKGYLHADAYRGYDKLFEKEGIYECACWMHVRRKFFEALDGPVEFRDNILKLIRNLYRYEGVLAKADAQTRLKLRKEKVSPIIDQIFKSARDAIINGRPKILPKSKIQGAITYLLNQETALKTFLSDPLIKPDNGASERAIRPLAIGRKNWMFAGSKNGGEATAIWLSLIQTCRSMDINPQAYLDDVLRRINSSIQLETLLPDRWKQTQQNISK